MPVHGPHQRSRLGRCILLTLSWATAFTSRTSLCRQTASREFARQYPSPHLGGCTREDEDLPIHRRCGAWASRLVASTGVLRKVCSAPRLVDYCWSNSFHGVLRFPSSSLYLSPRSLSLIYLPCRYFSDTTCCSRVAPTVSLLASTRVARGLCVCVGVYLAARVCGDVSPSQSPPPPLSCEPVRGASALARRRIITFFIII